MELNDEYMKVKGHSIACKKGFDSIIRFIRTRVRK